MNPNAIFVITVEEEPTGWQRALNQAKNDVRREQIYQRMAHRVELLSGWRVMPLTRAALGRREQFTAVATCGFKLNRKLHRDRRLMILAYRIKAGDNAIY